MSCRLDLRGGLGPTYGFEMLAAIFGLDRLDILEIGVPEIDPEFLEQPILLAYFVVGVRPLDLSAQLAYHLPLFLVLENSFGLFQLEMSGLLCWKCRGPLGMLH